jgi:hypothetical protein
MSMSVTIQFMVIGFRLCVQGLSPTVLCRCTERTRCSETDRQSRERREVRNQRCKQTKRKRKNQINRTEINKQTNKHSGK